MSRTTDRPLYLAAFVIGGLSTLVGAATIVTDVQSTGAPEGGSILTLLIGVAILAIAVTGPSRPDPDGRTDTRDEEQP